ncbi:MAG: hypothetical protein B1H08_03655 [Candidatus Omnitrophica bacterium 4484_171]|nr:MAG: hypothetical protein B1H08_03655 [Candidatus Omnitrophica bacterium 4484_171]
MINLAIEAAREAGKFLFDNFGKVKEIYTKGDRNLATELDRKAEEMIAGRIKTKYPAHGILGEEKERKELDNEWLWIIDPLDGTHNFIRGIDIFGVSIGIVHNNEFVAGVIYMPKDDELYSAESGSGAYKNSSPIHTSERSSLEDCSISFDSSIRYNPKRTLDVLNRVSVDVFNIRMFGSSVRTLTYVAEGKLDFAIEFHDRPWDFAGGVAIVREAGGRFSDLKGKPPTPKTIGYIASNGIIHSQVLNNFFPA